MQTEMNLMLPSLPSFRAVQEARLWADAPTRRKGLPTSIKPLSGNILTGMSRVLSPLCF